MSQKNHSKIVLADFSQSTSCHGMLQIHDSRKRNQKYFWIALVIIVIGIVTWQISDRIAAYFKYETSTQNTPVFTNGLQFPAVTICNLNRYFYVSGEERQALNTLSELYDFGSVDIDTLNTALQFFENQNSEFNFTDFVLSKTWDFEPAIINCQFGESKCGIGNFTPTFTSTLGTCWTFQTNLNQTKRGAQHGLQILLNISQDGYSENSINRRRSGAGVVVQIHAGYEPAAPESNGLTAGVGSWGSISMNLQQRRNMYTPWGQCRPDMENLQFSSVYSVAACFKEITDEYVTDTCNCRDPVVQHFTSYRECSAAEVLNCSAPRRSDFDFLENPSNFGCYQACRDVVYKTDISYSTYPSLHAARELNRTDNLSLEFLRENAVGLSIYYDRLTFTQTVQSKAISESALLSDIGGQLGLWIGISVVTLFEFFQLFYRLFKIYHPKQPVET